MKNDELISKLIEETCNEENSQKNSAIESLADYFDRRVNQVEHLSLNKYIIQQRLNAFEMNLNESTKCFRVSMKGCDLDFPSNWSIFALVENEELVFIDKLNDQDFLCDIFSEANEECNSFVLIKDNIEFKLVTFKEESGLEHAKWFKEYLLKQKVQDQEAA